MAGSASFNNLVGMSSRPAYLFGLMAFNLRWIKSSFTVISETEGTEHPLHSLCCERLLLARPVSSVASQTIP